MRWPTRGRPLRIRSPLHGSRRPSFPAEARPDPPTKRLTAAPFSSPFTSPSLIIKTTTHTYGDLVEIYGCLLAYINFDSDWHDCEDECDDEFCSTKLSERGQGVYDDRKPWKLIKAAPEMLEVLTDVLDQVTTDKPVDYQAIQKVIVRAA